MEIFSESLIICAGNSLYPVISPHNGQWRGILMFFICIRINDWVNNREAGYLRRHRAHYDVNVMHSAKDGASLFYGARALLGTPFLSHSSRPSRDLYNACCRTVYLKKPTLYFVFHNSSWFKPVIQPRLMFRNRCGSYLLTILGLYSLKTAVSPVYESPIINIRRSDAVLHADICNCIFEWKYLYFV